ncbi:sigma 54-interacting transcriptional regulator [bacterium]|nr:sigma 54-interacting transcriptional regulator [bacterium]
MMKSEITKKFIQTVNRIIAADSSVLIMGETGVGKEYLAKIIHNESPRNKGPFITI